MEQKTKCPHCQHIQDTWEKDVKTKMMCQFFKTKAYRKCEKCDELFNQEDNEIKERDGK